MAKKSKETCAFCGRFSEEVKMLISGIDAHICDECSVRANEIVMEEHPTKMNTNSTKKSKALSIKKPTEIKAFLDEYVIGQDEAKKYLSVAVYNHFKRLNHKKTSDIEIDKSNVILIGRTGTGKTLLAKTIAKLLNVPFTIVDATVFTEAGYVGEDIESILSRLLQVCDYDVEAAEKGIVYIDELDKIARKGDNVSLTRDVSGEGVQQGLLKILEGSEVNVPPYGGRKHPEQKMITVNTKNILFICGGAFDGLERIIGNRMNTRSIGFKDENALTPDDAAFLLDYATHQDIKNFGIIPELLGRLPVLTYLKPLDKDALKSILTVPKNAIIKQYIHLFDIEGIKLTFTEGALDKIAELAMNYELGARGLRSITEEVMNDLMFEAPTSNMKKIEITEEYINERITKSAKITKLKIA